jgi:lipopolysaccharide/colanic/teichoic acid biosynthesis glycosyltransferase
VLILGRKYIFTEVEKKQLSKKFKIFKQIDYKNTNPNETKNQIESLISNKEYNVIVLNTQGKVPDELVRYLTNLQFEKKIKLIGIEKFLESYLNKCYIPKDNEDLHFLDDIKPFNTFQYIQKRIIDFIGVSLLFLFGWPFIYIIKSKMKKESPGKLYFKQNRIGKDKKVFQCRKFRTMHENSYHDPYTKEGDDRIYPYGRFLRKSRIDELPQILNVIRGEIHLIGPRAEWDILVKEYEQKIPYYHERHLIKPGITGWGQVNYPYGTNVDDTIQKLMYDLYYIKHWTILLEIKIIFKTIMIVIGKRGL